MNAIAMIARCMKYSDNGSVSVDLGLIHETRADTEYVVAKLNERALPEEAMGHGNTSTEAQVDG